MAGKTGDWSDGGDRHLRAGTVKAMERSVISIRGVNSAQVRALVCAALACALLGLALAQRHGGTAAVPAAASSATATLPPGAQGAVSASLGAADPAYALRRADGALLGANPAAHLALKLGASGVTLSAGASRLRLDTVGVGYGAVSSAPARVVPSARGNRAVFARGATVDEWYANGPLGIEQGFTVARPPSSAADGPLTLSIALAGNARASLARDGRSILFAGSHGTWLRYGSLSATDATGRALHSWLELAGARIRLHVDARGARFPLRIDPLVQSELAAGEGAQSRFGFSVALSGDGATALVGAREGEGLKGGAWIFTRSGSTWSQQGPELQRGEAGEPGEGGSCEGEVLECAFGGAVALSSDGGTALVGAAGAFNHQGGVWVFTRSGSTWTQQGPTLTAADEKGRANFGRSVAPVSYTHLTLPTILRV